MTTECECSEDWGPCEEHCEVIAQREGASTRTADELCVVFIEDAVDLGVELSPWGQDTYRAAVDNLDANRSMGVAWFSDDEEGAELHDSVRGLVDQVENDLATMDEGYSVWWEDGYVISRVTGGPLSE